MSTRNCSEDADRGMLSGPGGPGLCFVSFGFFLKETLDDI